jgi:hypothetical protein
MNDQSDVPREYEAIPKELLKHGTGRMSHVILVPQPSDSPNDPLNVSISQENISIFRTNNVQWSIWKKDAILLIVGLSAAVVGAFGPMLSPGFVCIPRGNRFSYLAYSQVILPRIIS